MKTTFALILLTVPVLLFSEADTVGYLGVSTQGLSDAMRIALEIDHGLLVEKVHEDSPAEEAGIEPGDIITEIANERIDNYKNLKEAVRSRPNERVAVNIHRKGKQLKKTVVIGVRDKSKLRFEIDIPDLPDLKVILGTKELKEHIDDLKQDIERLKKEIEEIKKNLK
jgi:predicted metalloprotease with PDZ domain